MPLPGKRTRVRPLRLAALLLILLSVVGLKVAQRSGHIQLPVVGSSLFLPPEPRRYSPGRLDFSNFALPAQFQASGVQKDGLLALIDPRTIPAESATYLADHDRVIGIQLGGSARAYPLKILRHHEIVNDTLAQRPVAITYCPLTDSAVAFDRRSAAGQREFGVSGRLINSNVLMYDRGPPRESLWSQLLGRAITGPLANEPLEILPLELTSWTDWQARNPDTTVLSHRTGHRRNYDQNPYARYYQDPEPWFPTNRTSDLLPAKTPVLGVFSEGTARAYPLTFFDASHTTIHDRVAGHSLVLRHHPQSRSLYVEQADGDLRWVYAFWFAWFSFYPETDIWEP